MKGPSGSLFEPAEYKVENAASCEDLAFKLKGFSLNLAVKVKGSAEG
jgi:hypothetical protein